MQYDPLLATVLDWMTVFGFVTLTAFITWQIMTRSNTPQ